MPTPLQFGPVSIWAGQSSGKYPDGNQVIVKGSDSIAVFDTPLIANALPESAQFDSADLAILGHVHEDHMAGLHRIPHAPVHVHTGDLAAAQSWEGLAAHYGYAPAVLEPLHALLVREFRYSPRPDALAYEDGACWDLGGGVRVRAFHMPGHTAGHCVLLVEPGAVAFIGDIELSSFGPYYGDATSNLGDFRRTLARMVELPARVWITSHHKGVITDRDEFLRQLAAFSARIDAREERLLGLLAERPKTLAELARERVVYRPEARELWVESAEALSISRHLEELLSQGRVRQEGSHYGLV
jgi:glyoxylase-like metal-dependent hydrolase (beta-lactamase superfamily II)